TEGEVTLSAHILRRLGFHKDSYSDALPKEFTSLSADHAAQVIYLLGGYASGLARGSAHQLMSRATPNQVVDVFAGAGGILLDWPEGFYRFLESIRRPTGAAASRSGLEHEF